MTTEALAGDFSSSVPKISILHVLRVSANRRNSEDADLGDFTLENRLKINYTQQPGKRLIKRSLLQRILDWIRRLA